MKLWLRNILVFTLSIAPFAAPAAKEPPKNLPINPPPKASFLGPLRASPTNLQAYCSLESRCGLRQYVQQMGVCALFVIKGRTVRLEMYNEKEICGEGANGRNKDYGVASMAKSLTSTLLGQVLAEKYRLHTRSQFEAVLERRVGSFLGLSDRMKLAEGYATVTLDRLLSMRSDMQWRETGSLPTFSDSATFDNQVRLPHRKQSLIGFASKYRRRSGNPPGHFNYSALDAAMAVPVAANLSSVRPLLKAFEKGVWAMIGAAHPASWNVDIKGDPIGPCCFRARVDDMARFGKFVLDKGQGKIPAAWFDLATARLGSRFVGLEDESDQTGESCTLGYGYFWWLRKNRPDYFAYGRYGQFVHIYPEDDVVIVQFSDWNAVPVDKHARCIALKSHDAIVRRLR
ncbi:CubicO group peptidase (beta-lactamase class C family) [Rhizobium azibense]|nr:CubicO group peptidase (beta-lactamase class C family) [Rhizobium azibense]